MTTKNTKNETKHTPGPWREKDGLIVGNSNKLDTPIAMLNPATAVPFDELRPNARLIAAAPELLWVAARFLQCRRNSGNGDRGSVKKWTKKELEVSYADLENYALAAIAKATGNE